MKAATWSDAVRYVGAGLGMALVLAACGAPEPPPGAGFGGLTGEREADVPSKPAQPVTLNILDVAGDLQFTQPMIDEFVDENPDIVSRVTYSKSPAPELTSKIKAQQDAGRVSIDLVLTGNDGLAAGISQELWMPLVPQHQMRLKHMNDYLPAASKMQWLAQGYGAVVMYDPAGPLLEYNPEKVPHPPTNADALLAWAKENPGRMMYARPANSGPGRTLLMGLPYILGDKDPKDPVKGWDRTWAYLKELDNYIEYYPSGTTETMKNLGNGSVDLVASTTGWDINPRVLGTVPKEVEIAALDNFHWITDAHYAVVPKGVSAQKQSAILLLLDHMLSVGQQAKIYDDGTFLFGAAVKGVTLDMAPPESRATLEEFGRPEYDQLIADHPTETPLDADALVKAFDKWDRMIGGSKVKES
jgi:putative spermidine/putrescine transport system substrate-binding protein